MSELCMFFLFDLNMNINLAILIMPFIANIFNNYITNVFI